MKQQNFKEALRLSFIVALAISGVKEAIIVMVIYAFYWATHTFFK